MIADADIGNPLSPLDKYVHQVPLFLSQVIPHK